MMYNVLIMLLEVYLDTETLAGTVQSGSKTQVLESGITPDTSFGMIDKYAKVLKSKQLEWAQKVPTTARIALLRKTLQNLKTCKHEWALKDMEARHIPPDHWDQGTSYTNVACAGRLLHLYIESLQNIETQGIPALYKKAKQEGNRVLLNVFPRSVKESLILPGFHAEVHLKEGTSLDKLASYQGHLYRDSNYQGGVALVLGAGNGAGLSVGDVLHKLIVEKKVVLLKIHPVLDYLGGILTKIFEPFIHAGYLRIVMGGAKVGSYLTNHPSVDEIHMTGSDKTFEAIVYGGGKMGQKNKASDTPIIHKPVTGELGNVSPVIVMPGNWKDRDFDYQADNILFLLGCLNGYACCAARVLILPAYWDGSEKLLKAISRKMAEAKAPVNYYPGTNETIGEAMVCYPHMEKHGKLDENHQPWMLVKSLNPDKPEYAFRREFWASFMSQVYIKNQSPDEYLKKAVKFANEKLWGTLSATIIIDSHTQKEMTKTRALQKAIDELHYGTVAINSYTGISLLVGTTPWGGYPGATNSNIQSGNCFVNNPNMVEYIEKSVIYAPFYISPRPLWFITGKSHLKVIKFFTDFIISNKLSDFGRVLMATLFG